MNESIPRLESTRQFVTRMVLLNRFHAPDEPDYSEAHHALGAIHQGFPRAPIHEQCAYLVVGIARSRPFDEANFRTGWDYVSDLLAHRGFDLEATLLEAQELGNMVWDALEADEDPEAELASWFRSRIHKGLERQP